jgi:FixJ family two-component response regulator
MPSLRTAIERRWAFRRAVESHRHHIMHKMGFTSFSYPIQFAVRNNLVEL